MELDVSSDESGLQCNGDPIAASLKRFVMQWLMNVTDEL